VLLLLLPGPWIGGKLKSLLFGCANVIASFLNLCNVSIDFKLFPLNGDRLVCPDGSC